MDISVSELRELVMEREAWHAAIHGATKSQNWTEEQEKILPAPPNREWSCKTVNLKFT